MANSNNRKKSLNRMKLLIVELVSVLWSKVHVEILKNETLESVFKFKTIAKQFLKFE